MVHSTRPFPSLPSRDRSYSIELWAAPHADSTSTLAAFYTSDNLPRFAIRQSVSDLVLQKGHSRLFVDNVLKAGKPAFLAISATPRYLTVYLNGSEISHAAGLQVNNDDFSGTLSLGVSPREDDGWTGRLQGFAVYATALTSGQVKEHFESWTAAGHPPLSPADQPAAVYDFHEAAGQIAHNLVAGGPDLLIPGKFTLVHAKFLSPVWKEYYPKFSYLQDLFINIAGFVPLGFFFYPWRSLRCKHPVLFTVLFGLGVSLLIEVGQGFLPTRQSGTTDLITNTLGTALGVGLARSRFLRPVVTRALTAALTLTVSAQRL